MCSKNSHYLLYPNWESVYKKINSSLIDLYTFEKVSYVNYHTSITVTCKNHGDFNIVPISLIKGKGCPVCSDKLTAKSNTSKFIEKASVIHNNFYDYSLVNYEQSVKAVKIICPVHGEFEQAPINHLVGKRMF